MINELFHLHFLHFQSVLCCLINQSLFWRLSGSLFSTPFSLKTTLFHLYIVFILCVHDAGWVFDSCQLKAARPRHFQRSNKLCHVVRSLMYANEGVEGRERVHKHSKEKRKTAKWQIHKGTSKTCTAQKPVLHLKTGVSGVKSTRMKLSE